MASISHPPPPRADDDAARPLDVPPSHIRFPPTRAIWLPLPKAENLPSGDLSTHTHTHTQKVEFSSRCLPKCRNSVSYSEDTMSTIVKILSMDVEILPFHNGEILSPIVETLSANVGILSPMSLIWETPRGEFHLLATIGEILSVSTILGDTSRRIPPREETCEETSVSAMLEETAVSLCLNL